MIETDVKDTVRTRTLISISDADSLFVYSNISGVALQSLPQEQSMMDSIGTRSSTSSFENLEALTSFRPACSYANFMN